MICDHVPDPPPAAGWGGDRPPGGGWGVVAVVVVFWAAVAGAWYAIGLWAAVTLVAVLFLSFLAACRIHDHTRSR